MHAITPFMPFYCTAMVILSLPKEEDGKDEQTLNPSFCINNSPPWIIDFTATRKADYRTSLSK